MTSFNMGRLMHQESLMILDDMVLDEGRSRCIGMDSMTVFFHCVSHGGVPLTRQPSSSAFFVIVFFLGRAFVGLV